MILGVSERAVEAEVQYELIPPAESPETPAVYSNFAQATVSPHDMTLHFGWFAVPPLMEPPEETVQVPIRPLVKVTIPLNLVRGTIALLQRQLEAWEGSYGQQMPTEPPSAARPESQAEHE
jgi:hypothetical protein